jgi:hypothetical protein
MDGEFSIALRHPSASTYSGLGQFSEGELRSTRTAPRPLSSRQIEQICFAAGLCVACSIRLGELP